MVKASIICCKICIYVLLWKNSESVRYDEKANGSLSFFSSCHDLPIEKDLPFWSWGFSTSCCDIFPLNAETGSNVNYFLEKNISDHNVVFVYSPFFKLFLEKNFIHFPNGIRVTIVVGMSDLHAPWEASFESRFPLLQFISDPRLHRLFVQNYDFVGCNPLTSFCSTISVEEDLRFRDKIFPLPIGLDFHTFAGKGDMHRPTFHERVCDQRMYLRDVQAEALPFPQRKLSIVVGFDCSFMKHKGRGKGDAVVDSGNWRKGPGQGWGEDDGTSLINNAARDNLRVSADVTRTRWRGRGELCRLIYRHSRIHRHGHQHATVHPHSQGNTSTSTRPQIANFSIRSTAPALLGVDPLLHVVESSNGEAGRALFWKALGRHAFALAPFGHGLDTHRFWEILHMGAIPIVASSPMDRLYQLFPSVVVRSYEEVMDVAVLEQHRRRIEAKFGLYPFTEEVRRRLSMQHWIDQVRNFSSATPR